MAKPSFNPQHRGGNLKQPRRGVSFIIFFLFATLLYFLFASNTVAEVDLTFDEFLSILEGEYTLEENIQDGSAKNKETVSNSFVQKVREDEDNVYYHYKGSSEEKSLPKKEFYLRAKKIREFQDVVAYQNGKIKGSIIYLEDRVPISDAKTSLMYPSVNKSDKVANLVAFTSMIPANSSYLLLKLAQSNISVEIRDVEENSIFLSAFLSFLPWILIILVFRLFIGRQMGNANTRAFSFGKSKAKMYQKGNEKITFADVAGSEEAKAELKEIADFLKSPERFLKMGAKIPKGVLLSGSPGTGKTLLARAVAGEADRPFFSVSGSEFVEMFVGVGASRVRDLFETAKKHSPCILFIDELDAVGRSRGTGLGGGNDEREQTLNQILVEMDGFEQSSTIIVIAATNRPDVLDPALLRPGRFDRQISVDLPTAKEREEILMIHSKKKPLDASVNLKVIARGTPGFSGADLENILNEATLIAARHNQKTVTNDNIEEAIDKKLMGYQKKSLYIRKHEKERTAYHEAGHTLVAHLLKETDPVHKVTIIPRGRSLGLTQQLPLDDRVGYTKVYLLNRIAILMGGRVAEEYKYDKDHITTGALADIRMATEIAHGLVRKFGMSNKLGMVAYEQGEPLPFLGKTLSQGGQMYSEATASLIDQEVLDIITHEYARAKEILTTHQDKLEKLTALLIEKETIDRRDIESILGPKELSIDESADVETQTTAQEVVKTVEGDSMPNASENNATEPATPHSDSDSDSENSKS